ncbi:MAG: S-layer protein, partial [Verrucomicrobiota bacterium]
MRLSLSKLLLLVALVGMVPLEGKTVAPTALSLHGGGGTEGVRLIGPDASQQLVVTSVLADGGELDVTREVHFSAEPAGVVQIDKHGAMTPVANGKANVTARSIEGLTSTVAVEVMQVETPQAVNFPNEVVPLFTKYGCNGGGCHGKSEGQNGFR